MTGGAGFIGSHLVEHLLARGDAVTVIDNLSTGRLDNLPSPEAPPAAGRLRVIQADLSKALDALASAGDPDQPVTGERFDEIYHLAAVVGVKLIVEQPIRSIEVNVEQTSHLLRYALRHGPAGPAGEPTPAPTLIASSSEVYGKSDKVPFSEEDDVTYGPTTKTRWSYACAKAIDEWLAIAHHQHHHAPTVVARFFNTVGPRQLGRYGMVLPNFVASALAGQPIMIHGDGQQTRCFCDVRDVVSVLPRLLASPACYGRVFNVGSDRSISIEGLADLVISVTGSSSRKQFVPYENAYAAGFEDLRQRQPDLTRISSTVGWRPSIPLEQTIRDVAAEQASRRATLDPGGIRR